MSQSRELDEDTEMAISYASRAPAGHPQMLPSFREVRQAETNIDADADNTNNSSSHHISTTKSTPPPTTTPDPHHRSARHPATRWRPTHAQSRAIHPTHPRKPPTANTHIPANTPPAQASTHHDQWATPCPCEDRVPSSHRSETCNPCPSGKDIPQTAGWHHGPTPLRTIIGPANRHKYQAP